MKTIFIFIGLIMILPMLPGQTPSDQVVPEPILEQLDQIERSLNNLKKSYAGTRARVQRQEALADTFRLDLLEAGSNMLALQVQIQSNSDSIARFKEITESSLSKHGDTTRYLHRLLWIITAGIALAIFGTIWWLRRAAERQKKSWAHTAKKQETGFLNVDAQIADLLKRLLEAIPQTASDHALPLKVGEEIFRMRQRIAALPSGLKGLEPMKKSLERLEQTFNELGYQLVDHLHQPFNDGMTVKARLIPSDALNPGEKIISKIIKPQINLNGQLLQVAEIEVSTGD